MKKYIDLLRNNQLISGSSVIFIGSFIANIGNYFYNLLMGRMLSVNDYGLLISLTSLFILLSLFSNAFTTPFTKFSAAYKGAENETGLRILFVYGFRILSVYGSLLLFILVFCTPIIQNMLRINDIQYIFIIFLSVLLSLFLTLPQGILQGRMQFIFLSIVNISQPLIKIIVAYFLLVAGVGVLSPLVGIALSLFIPLVILYIYFFQKFKRKNNDGNVDQNQLKSELIKYSTASFLAGVGIAVLTNTDILLVRYFFDEVVSGQYAALSLMGKAIFYLIMPINFAFFPLIAYKRERKERLFHTVLLALGIVLLASVSLSFIYFAFPNLILKIFFPLPEYRVLAGYLGLFSLYIMMFSLATILFNFFLSIGRTEVYKISLIAAVAQVGAITFFHASLYQVIGSMFIVSLLFFIFLLGYYVKHERD